MSRMLLLSAVAGAVLLAVGLALAAFYPSSQAAGPEAAEEVVATFEGGEITRGELQDQIDAFAGANGLGNAPPGSSEYEAALSQVMPYLVRVELAGAYAREHGLGIPESQVSEEVEGGTNPNDPKLREDARDRLILRRVQQEVAGGGPPTAEEVRAEYDRVKDLRYTLPERRCARQILFEEGQEALAMEVKAKLERGANFAELADVHSRDPLSRTKGGDIGCWERNGTLTPHAVEEALFEAEEGEIVDPISSGRGLHLVEVTEVQQRGTAPLEEVAPRIKEELTRKNRDKRFDAWVREQVRERNLEYRLPDYEPPV